MTNLRIIIESGAVDAYLAEHGLEVGAIPIEAALLQHGGTEEGRACAMLVFVDPETGKRVLLKTTLRLLESAVRVMVASDTAAGHG